MDDEVRRLIAARKAEEEAQRQKLAPHLAEARRDAREREMVFYDDPRDAFRARVRIEGEHWIWIGAQQFTFAGEKHRPARFAYTHIERMGQLKKSTRLRRTCKAGGCVNPRHFEAIETRPKKKSKKKGRLFRGRETEAGKYLRRHKAPFPSTESLYGLSDDDVHYIRARHAEGGISYEALGKKMGVSKRAIKAIVSEGET